MKTHIEQIKANDKFYGEKNNSVFVDSEFVKTCDELAIGVLRKKHVQLKITLTKTYIRALSTL